MKALPSTIIILFLAAVSLAGEWHIEDLDPSLPNNYSDTSIGLDSSDIPYIAYFNQDRLLLARREGGSWSIETVDEEGPFLFYVSLVLDGQDRPRIAYYQTHPEGDLKYARWTGTEWIIETVDSEGYVGGHCSLALDSSDHPCIAYVDAHDGEPIDLKYARWDGDEWQYEHVDTGGDTCYYISLALDSNDRPHISYQKKDDAYDLRYAHWDGSSWIVETVDAEGDSGAFSSIAVDSQDRPHIAYKNGIVVRYAYKDSSEWSIHTVDPEEETRCGGFTSLALDSMNLPYIVDYETNEIIECPRCSYWYGERWRCEYVSPYDMGFRNSIGVDSHDQPHISYIGYCEERGDIGLKYAWCEIFFRLLSPGKGEVVSTLTPTLDWSDDYTPDLESYTLWWGEDPDFENYNEVTDIGESEYRITEGIEDGDRIYWRVKSIDDGGEERWAEEMDWNFTVYLNFNPDFHLLEPERGEVVDTTTPTLDWEDQKIPNLESYTLWWGEAPDFETYNEVVGIGESEYRITEGIEDGDRVWWRVKSIDEEGEEYWAEELDWYFDVDLSGGVEIVDLGADAADGGVLVKWEITGDTPAGLRVLRSVGEGEPVAIHENQLPGTATSYLDRLDKGLKPLASGIEYRYWLEVTEADGTTSRFGPTEAVTVPEETFNLVLYAAYPSPSREVINFVYSLPAEGRVTLSVYDLSGRRVATLIDTEQTVGRHEASWNCGEVPPGVYLYSLQTAAGSLTQRLVIGR
jgi:hypothetical protein